MFRDATGIHPLAVSFPSYTSTGCSYILSIHPLVVPISFIIHLLVASLSFIIYPLVASLTLLILGWPCNGPFTGIFWQCALCFITCEYFLNLSGNMFFRKNSTENTSKTISRNQINVRKCLIEVWWRFYYGSCPSFCFVYPL